MDNPIPIVAIGLLGLLALAGRRDERRKDTTPRPGTAEPDDAGPTPTDVEVSTGHRAYMEALYAQQREFGPQLQADWGLDRLRAVALAASQWMTDQGYPVDAAQLWGLMYRESNWLPIGVYGVYGPPADWPEQLPAASYKSSAYGMSQILRSRFNESALPWAEANLGDTIWWDHEALLWPRLAIWTTAAELARLADRRGRAPTDYEVGQWWACPGSDCEGAKKKAESIAATGDTVYATGDIAGIATRAVAGPPVQATDLMPPTPEDWFV